jgi:hypothetical protein
MIVPCRGLRSRAEQPLNLFQQLVWPNRLEEPPSGRMDDQSVIQPKSLTWQTTAIEADTGRSALAARTGLLPRTGPPTNPSMVQQVRSGMGGKSWQTLAAMMVTIDEDFKREWLAG